MSAEDWLTATRSMPATGATIVSTTGAPVVLPAWPR
jgi:hypothetical protein